MRCSRCDARNPDDATTCRECRQPLSPAPAREDEPTHVTPPAPAELTSGAVFAGRYRVIEELGRGGMGRVYKVFDTEVREKVALKLLETAIARDHAAIARFREELRLARRIRDPHVCQMFDLGAHEGTLFITMEYVAGEDLKQMIRMSGQLSVGTAVHVARQVCKGLAAAHALGIVHCDLKPQNVMIDHDGDAHIMDFGIARSLTGRDADGTAVIAGTPGYMSPEQADARDVDHRTDIHALGVILYEMLTGQLPFDGTTPRAATAARRVGPPRPPIDIQPHIPKDLNAVVLRCLEPDRDRRYDSAESLLAELDRIQADVPATNPLLPRRRPSTSRTARPGTGRPLAIRLVLVLVVLGVAVALGVRHWGARRGAPLDSIAVLPFAYANSDPATEYLRDGIPDSLIARLSELDGLKKVIASSSTARYKDRQVDPQQVGHELDVAAVLTGRIQRVGRVLSVSVELVNAHDGSLIWSRRYESALDATLALDDTIASDTADNLRLRLTTASRERLARRYTTKPEAYEAYLKGRFYWGKRTGDGLTTAIEYFNRALDLDPGYAQAYAGLSDSYALLARYSYLPPGDAMPRAKAAAQQALAIDGALGEAHTSLAFVMRQYDWDWAGAEREFRNAIDLSPNYATAHHWYAILLANLGRHDEAVAEMARALALDPLSLIINTNVGWMYYFAGQHDRAVEQFRRTLEMDPTYAVAHQRLGQTYVEMRDMERAVEEFREAVALAPRSTETKAALGHALALSGSTLDAQASLKVLLAPGAAYVAPYDVALVYTALGDKPRALDWLERGYAERSNMVFVKVDPRFAPLREEPRYRAILVKMRLAPAP